MLVILMTSAPLNDPVERLVEPDPSLPALPHVPSVGVVMPILDEERHLQEAVDAVLGQDYDGPLHLVLALGPSHDRTDEIARGITEREPRVRSVANPSGRTPEALNAALAALDEVDVVVRVDGHGVLDRDYVSTAVSLLAETGAANVGGLMDAEGVTSFERGVAAAMTSRLGVGAARFHTGGDAGPADTVYLGVFRRAWLTRMGGYDRRFVRAQDWELNHRIREAGGLIWFSPRLRVAYRPRPTLAALARQYRDYGRWRRVVARTHAGTINARYLAPPAALVGVVAGLVGGFVWWPLWLAPAGYLVLTTIGGLTVRDTRLRPADRLWLPLVLPTMHLCWGWGFLTSRVRIEDRAEA
jgi:glycosyltransferase involved in cell wall biosynthesis